MSKPVVALVGRPNVGKSTFFNRLVGEPLAIVDDTPGTTRDRLFGEALWNGIAFDVIDTGGIDPTSRSGLEPLSVGSSDFINEIRLQAQIAIQEADAILFLTEAISGVTPADREVAQILRRSQKIVDGVARPPVFLVVNKADSANLRQEVPEFYELGMGEPYAISSLHGTGTGDLLDDLVKSFQSPDETAEDDSVKIALVGKPNVGKSSLLNRLAGEERAIVSPIPGTTRDAIDTVMEYDGVKITLIDTAGIRKRGKVEPGVEKYSVLRTMRALERCEVALLMIDATSGITAQDTHIAGYILENWKSTIVLVNKWDAVEKDSYTMNSYTEKIPASLILCPTCRFCLSRPRQASAWSRCCRRRCVCRKNALRACPPGRSTAFCRKPRKNTRQRHGRDAPFISITARRCEATHPLSCYLSTIQNWGTSPICATWRTASARSILSPELPFVW